MYEPLKAGGEAEFSLEKRKMQGNAVMHVYDADSLQWFVMG